MNHVAVCQNVRQRHKPGIDSRSQTVLAHVGVDAVGEIYGRGTGVRINT